jgi:DNA-binding MarR family transcriptional regulator
MTARPDHGGAGRVGLTPGFSSRPAPSWDDLVMARQLSSADYEQLLRFRTGLRRFLRRSEEEATAAGLTPAQHQLLLAIRGHTDAAAPTIGEVADALLVRHHSAVGLVDRAEAAGLVRRRVDRDDARVVRLALTPAGARRLAHLTNAHLEELAVLASTLRPLSEVLTERGYLRDA